MADDLLKRQFDNRDHQEHVERVGERMRDVSELDNLKADVRQSKGRELLMPWRTGRPLRSAGEDPNTGLPRTPLAAIDIKQLATPGEIAAAGREMDRVVLHDAISEGVLDQAEREGVPLVVEDTPYDTDTQAQADEREVAEQLKASGAPPEAA